MRRAITLLLKAEQDSKKLKDFGFYGTVIKPEMVAANPKVYEYIINKASLSTKPYGVSRRSNKAGQTQTMRDPDSTLSIFDSDAFRFYLLKYSEQLGSTSLVAFASTDRTISYD